LLFTVHNRPQINLEGLVDFSLPGIHNQLLPLLSATFLGYLSMRLARQLSVPIVNSFILGMGTQMVYLTFPNNLWFFWKTYPASWWIFYMAVFWTLAVNQNYEEQKDYTLSWLSISVLAGMYWVDWIATFILIMFYCMVSMRRPTVVSMKEYFLQLAKAPLVLGVGVLVVKYTLIYLGISLLTGISSEFFLQAYCEEGVRGLVLRPFPPQLPSWSILIVLGVISTIAVLIFVERKEKLFFHQVILISGVAAFLFSKKLTHGAFHEYGVYDTFLAFPLILALLTLVPAWLENFNGHSGIFILVATLLAFCSSFIQLRNYAVLYPIPGPNFYSACLSGPFYH